MNIESETEIARVEDRELTPQARAAAFMRREFERAHPERKAEALAELRAFADVFVREFPANNFAAIERARAALHYAINLFTMPKPAPDVWPQLRIALTRHGWDSGDLDALTHQFKPGAAIGAYDYRGIELNGRRITREDLRLGRRPAWSKVDDASWLRQFPQIVASAMAPAEND